jgi:carbonic anhydrase
MEDYMAARISVLTAIIVMLSACAPAGTPAASPAPAATETHAPGAAAVHWSYEGEEGPDHWPGVCLTGTQQSPINLMAPIMRDLANIAFHYQTSKVNVFNNGHTVQVNYDSGSYIEVDGMRYDLLQFHFHAPSEHTIDGAAAAAELHLVHKNADGRLAVVGVLIKAGDANPAFDAAWWDNLPKTESVKDAQGAYVPQAFDVDVAAQAMLPAVQTTFRYDGSLTTPPCTQGVRWLVMTEPITLSAAQLEQFTSIFKDNARPVQDPHSRVLLEDSTP